MLSENQPGMSKLRLHATRLHTSLSTAPATTPVNRNPPPHRLRVQQHASVSMDLELTLMFHRCSTSIGLIRVGPDHNYMIVTHLATVLKEKFIIGFAECRRSLVRLLVSVLLSAKQAPTPIMPTDTHNRSAGACWFNRLGGGCHSDLAEVIGARADLAGLAADERSGAVDRGHGLAHRLHRPGAAGAEASARLQGPRGQAGRAAGGRKENPGEPAGVERGHGGAGCPGRELHLVSGSLAC